jgi:hypothetical protein
MDSFNTGQRTVPFTNCASHKHFMFNVDFWVDIQINLSSQKNYFCNKNAS